MAGKAVAIDLGSHSVKAIAVRAGKHGLAVTRFCAVPADEGAAAIAAAGLPLKGVVAGLRGRDMTLRYSQVPPTPDWQLQNLMDLEIQDLAAQSGGALSADYNLLPTQDEEAQVDTVLLALAKDEALERLQDEVRQGGGSVAGFVPNCVALYNAYLKCGPVDPDAVVCLASFGHDTIDIALCKGTDLLFARNLTGGGKVLDDAIAAAFNVSPRKAEALKRDLLDLDPQSRGRFASGQAEKVTMAAGGAASAFVAGIQSSLAFCKAQTKIADLRLDKVLLCGGSARLRGLRGLLREALRCPVEPFDPFANCDLTALPPAEAEQLSAMRGEAVVALGLAAGACDDSLYSLEILPEAVRKRQRFAQRTVFNIAAVAIAVLLLVQQARTARARLEAAETQLSTVRRQRNRAEDIDKEARALVAQNQQQRALCDYLAGEAVPLHGTLRTLRALGEHLPQQLWLTRVQVAKPAGGGQPKAAPVEFTVKGKELGGVNVGDTYLQFANEFKRDARLPQSGITSKEVRGSTPGAGASMEQQYSIDFLAAEPPPPAKPQGKGGR